MNIKNRKSVILIMFIMISLIGNAVFSGCTVKDSEAVEAMNMIADTSTDTEKILIDENTEAATETTTEEITEEITQKLTQTETESAIQAAVLTEAISVAVEAIEEVEEIEEVKIVEEIISAATQTSLTSLPTLPRPPRNPDEKLIAITFDDGPSKYTEQILDILTQYGGKSTFFVVGYKVWDYSEIIKKTIEQGSEVAGHSWHHYNFLHLDEQDIKDQITYTADAIKQVTEVKPPDFYRIPYGEFDDRVKDISRDVGAALIQWNIDPRDWSKRNADAVYEHIMENAKDGGIIVCHDTYGETAEAMERVIPELVEQGYRLVTVSELLWYTEPGKVYFSESDSILPVN